MIGFPELTDAGGALLVVDVGGTDVKSAVVDAAGRLGEVGSERTPTGADGAATAQAVLDWLTARAEDAHREHGISAIGLLVPGVVDADAGVARFSENLGWRDVPFRSRLEERTGLPVGFGHDVATAGRAEFELGAARGSRDAAVLMLGTGIAAAVFADGRAVLGRGFAGELGHSTVVAEGEPCVCGGRGCLEAIASAAAIARRYRSRGGDQVAGAREVLERADDGDELAARVWDEAIEALAIGIRQLAAILAPETVVLGGGLANAGPRLLAPLGRALETRLTMQPMPRLVPARFGSHAGLIGAALVARDRLALRSPA